MGAPKDLTNQTFNYWTVLYKTDKRDSVGNVYWHCKCKCGNEKDIIGTSLTSGKSKSCGCFKKQKASLIKNDYTNQKFGSLLALYPIKKDNDEKHLYWHCKCDCGNECDIRSDRLPKATSCGCKTNEKRAKSCLDDLTGQRFGKLVVLESFYDVNKQIHYQKTYWKCLCDCGNICYVLPGSLKTGVTQSCGCLGNSIGENNIEQLLKNNNIQYEKEKTFEDCIFVDTNKKGRYDFYLINENRLIEFDGRQHFSPEENGWNTLETFQIRKEHDKIKNKWAKEHNIPLVRIPYWERDNITLEMIMGDKYLI